jgi:hypothetical protein
MAGSIAEFQALACENARIGEKISENREALLLVERHIVFLIETSCFEEFAQGGGMLIAVLANIEGSEIEAKEFNLADQSTQFALSEFAFAIGVETIADEAKVL